MRLMGMVVSMILVAGHAIAEECDRDQISTMIIDMKRWQNELERDDKLRSMDFMSGYYTSLSLAISSATAARTEEDKMATYADACRIHDQAKAALSLQ